MTLFQARFIQWLSLIGCSQRAIAGNYYGRYNEDGTRRNVPNDYEGFGGNQIDGILLVEEAIKTLIKHGKDPIMDDPNFEDVKTFKPF